MFTNKIKAFLSVVAFFATASANAVDLISAFSAPPDTGIYWNPEEPGNGYSVDIDSTGNVFVAWYTYTNDGAPVWYTMSGKIERASPQWVGYSLTPDCTNVPLVESCIGDKIRFLKTGLLARVTSKVYSVVNGACPTCPPRFPVVSESALGPATIEWFGSRSAVLTFQGRTVAIQRQDIATPVRDLVSNVSFNGVMYALVAGIGGGANTTQAYPFTARFAPAGLITSVSTTTAPVLGLPGGLSVDISALNLNAPTTRYYLGSVVGNTATFEQDKVIAIDEKNNRAYLLIGTTPIGGFQFKVSSYGELFIYGDRMISWPVKPTTLGGAGIFLSNSEWKFDRTRPPITFSY